jgi:hypothetical protein
MPRMVPAWQPMKGAGRGGLPGNRACGAGTARWIALGRPARRGRVRTAASLRRRPGIGRADVVAAADDRLVGGTLTSSATRAPANPGMRPRRHAGARGGRPGRPARSVGAPPALCRRPAAAGSGCHGSESMILWTCTTAPYGTARWPDRSMPLRRRRFATPTTPERWQACFAGLRCCRLLAPGHRFGQPTVVEAPAHQLGHDNG